MKKILLLLCLFLGVYSFASAQISLSSCGVNYIQNFNSLPRNPAQTPNRCNTNFAWTDNTTIAGWYITQQANNYTIDNGNCTTASIYSYGTDGISDRTLGSMAGGGNAVIQYGAQFQNNTSGGVNRITVNYLGESWHGSNLPNTLAFEYSLDATNLTNGTWTRVNALDLVHQGSNGGQILNGNVAPNQQTISGMINLTQVIAAGQTFWVRFTDTDDAGDNAGFGIDNFRINVSVQPIGAVTGTNAVCNIDPTNYNYSVNPSPGLTYIWSGIPLGASIPNGIIGNTIQIGWNGVPQGNYTLTVGATGLSCAVANVNYMVQVRSVPNTGTLASDRTVCQSNNSGILTLSGYSGTIARWESSTDNFVNNITQIPALTSSYIFSGLVQTTYYRVVLVNGACTAVSPSVMITVVPTTQGGTITPAVTTLCTPNLNNLTLTLAGQTGNILRWESSINNFQTVTTINNTNATLDLVNLTQSTVYRAVVQNSPCAAVNSAVSTITVNPTAVGGTLTADQTVCELEVPNTLRLTGYAGNIASWESSTDGFQTVNTINVNTPTYTPQGSLITTQYRVQIVSPGCGTATSNAITVTVNPPAVAGTLSAAQSLCMGAVGNDLMLTGYTGNIVRWESSTDGFLTATTINNTNPTYNFGLLTRTTRFRAVVGSPGCPNRNSNQVEILISNMPEAGILTSSSASSTNCNSNTGTITLTNYTGTIIRWESSVDNFITVNPIPNTLATYNYTIAVPTKFRVVLGNGGCLNVTTAPISVTSGITLSLTGGLQCTNSGKITATTMGGTPAYRYYISPNSGSQTSPGVFVNVAPGKYIVTVMDFYNCYTTQTITVPTFLSPPNITSIVLNGGGNVKVNWDVVLPGGVNTFYQVRYKRVIDPSWTLSATLFTNYYNIALTPLTDYQVQVRVKCGQSLSWSAWSPTSTFNSGMRMENQTESLNETISVFPNPSKGTFNLRFNEVNFEKATVEILDLNGKMIFNQTVNVTESVLQLPQTTTAGVYLMRIHTNEGQPKFLKLVIE